MACKENCNCTIFHQETLNKVEKEMFDEKEFIELSNLFKLFSDPTRVKILKAVEIDELCVCDLGHLIGVSKSAISHQMKLLKKHKLVDSRKEGKMVYYSLKDPNVSVLLNKGMIHTKGKDL